MKSRYPWAAAAVMLLSSHEMQAKRPELDAVFWGSVAHQGTAALRPAYLGEITVSAWQNGVKLAELAVPPSAAPAASRYVLKVPIDDGVEPRLPGTARRGERVIVKIRNATLNLEVESTQTTGTTGLLIPTTKGAITVQNLSTVDFLGGASPLMARYAFWKAERQFQVDVLDPDADTDGDGMSNFAEFLANTDPQSGSQLIRILDVLHKQDVSSVKVGPVKSGRLYTLWCSASLVAGDWQRVGTFTASADEAHHWFDHVSTQNGLFYRLEVTVQ
jgi:hypothetical protein